MALVECTNGHLYDTDQYSYCPYCSGNMNRVEFGNFAPAQPAAAEVGATVAPGFYQAPAQQGFNNGANANVGKTVAVLQKSMSIEPVVGWLVCIDGKEKGKDYRIGAKNNSIGRDERMDISIKGDDTISRENHARLAYDVKHNNFHLIPGEGTNGVYIGEEPVYVPTVLNAYDVIEIGESKFLFIPLCGEKFTWQDGLKQEG